MKPCMYCQRPTNHACICGAHVCEEHGSALCPLCVRIQSLIIGQAMVRKLRFHEQETAVTLARGEDYRTEKIPELV